MRPRRELVLLSGLGLILACSDSTGPDPLTISQLVGSWHLTSLVVTTHEQPPRSRDRVADGTQTQTLTVTSNGDFTLNACVPNVLCADLSGTIEIAGDSIRFVYESVGPSTESVRLAGSTLTLKRDYIGYFLETDDVTQSLSSRRVFQRQ